MENTFIKILKSLEGKVVRNVESVIPDDGYQYIVITTDEESVYITLDEDEIDFIARREAIL